MNQRERLLAVFNKEKPDLTPWYADLCWWCGAQKETGKLPKKYEEGKYGEGYLRLHQDVGAGLYIPPDIYPPLIWKEVFKEGIKCVQKREGNRIFEKIITPMGELSSVQEYQPESFTQGYKEYFVKNMDDLKIMLYYYQNRIISPSCEGFDYFAKMDKLWNGWGIPDLCGPICTSPVQNLLTRWSGVETGIFLLADNEEEIEGIIKEFEKCDDRIFDIICDSPAQLIELPENLSGEVTGRKLLEKYSLPYLRKRINQLHEAGKFTLLHNDGTLKASLPLLTRIGLDAVEAVTPAPVGDLSLEEIAEIAKDKIIIFGGLPGALFSPCYPENFFKDYLRKVLRTFPPGSGFVLASADQVPPDAEFSRIALVKKILENDDF